MLRHPCRCRRGGGAEFFLKPAFAACTPGAQCEANGFSETPANNSNFQAIGAGANNAALVSTNGGLITGSQINAGMPVPLTTPGWYAAFIETGGSMDLTNSTLSGWLGLHANTGSFALNGGKVEAVERAIRLHAGASAVLDGVNVDYTNGVNSEAVVVSSSSLTMTGGKIDSKSGAIGVLGTNSTATLTDVDLISTGPAISFAGNSSITVNGGSITQSYTDTYAILAGLGTLTVDDGTNITSAGGGISLFNTTGDFSNFNVTLTGTKSDGGIRIRQGSTATLKTGSISTKGNIAYGIYVEGSNTESAPLMADDVSITTEGNFANAVFSRGSGTSTLADMTIKTSGGTAHGINSEGVNASIRMTGGTIGTTGATSYGALATLGAQVHLDDVKVTTAQADTVGAFVFNGSSGSIKNSGIDSQGHGVAVQLNSHMDVENSTIASHGAGLAGLRVEFNATASVSKNSSISANGAGLFFQGAASAVNSVTLEGSSLTSTQSAAVLARGGTDTLNANNSIVGGDVLAFAGSTGSGTASQLRLSANNSQLSGHANRDAASTLSMDLRNAARWTLRPSATLTTRDSSISTLRLENSLITFDNLGNDATQQTLTIGAGTGTVYEAVGNAVIRFNTYIDTGATGKLKTDRVLIDGEVAGVTYLDPRDLPGSPGGLTGHGATDGISLVQVSGSAAAGENAFQLVGGYTTTGGLPYTYSIQAFGAGYSNGEADAGERLVAGTGAFSDYRLQSDAQTSSASSPPAVAPQVSSYLAAPNALFQAGLLDVAGLHQRLGETRQSEHLPLEERKRHAFFLRGYGGDYGYRSNRSPAQYGVNADVRYAATQMGATTRWVDKIESHVRAGLAVSYGDLSFAPRHAANSRKTKMDTWSISPALTWQHNSGAYVDTVLAYRQFKGDVSTSLRGTTATLQGHSTAFSSEVGTPFPVAGWIVEPHMQIVYQRLKFNRTQDVDGFPVDVGQVEQWTLRTGGFVKKTLTAAMGSRIQLHGKLHLTRAMNKRKKIWLGDDFEPGKAGSTLDAGLGINATLAGGRAALHAEITRQQRISRAGHQGWAANLGVKVRF